LTIIVDDFQQIVALETGLHGLFHWRREYEAAYRSGPVGAERANWYYSALLLHADVAFTSNRARDSQTGAALRALRDLGRPELVRKLVTALDAPATDKGQPLGVVIKRIRNEMLAHISYRMSDYGPALLLVGSKSNQFADAFAALLEASKEVLQSLHDMKLELIERMPAGQSLELMDSAAERARASVQAQRSEQSRLDKRKREVGSQMKSMLP
jgi:hypothetical protein